MNAARPSHFSAAGAGAYSRPATKPLNMRRDMAGAHTTPSGSQFQDTYMLDRSYVPMLGATINNISIEPALQQHQQVAHPQGAAQHFNFSPGSYATFTAQHNSGNLHNSGNGAPPHPAPVEVDTNAEQRAYDAVRRDFTHDSDYSEEEGDSSSKGCAEKTAVAVNGQQSLNSNPVMPPPSKPTRDTAYLQGRLHMPHLGQPPMAMPNGYLSPPLDTFHQQQPMHNNTPYGQQPMPNDSLLDFGFPAHHGASRREAYPQALEYSLLNSPVDQTMYNNMTYQAGMVQTQAPVSSANKRRLSSVGGGGMADSSGGLGVTQQDAKRMRIETGAEGASPVNTNFGQRPLRGMTSEEAAGHFTRRSSMVFDNEPDDVDEVEANKEGWIKEIMAAFARPYSAKPVLQDFKHLLEGFGPYQEKYYLKTKKVIDNDKTGDIVEAAATILYSRVVNSHRTNTLDMGGASLPCNRKLTCSERMKWCIHAIEMLTIIRHDVIRNSHIVELVSNPERLIKRKEDCKYSADERKVELETHVPAKPRSARTKGSSGGTVTSKVSMSDSDED
jgi:hypothetical protein